MTTLVKTAKVSRKGQITLPRQVRTLLGTDHVRIVVEKGQVRIERSPDPGGSLHRYARRRRIPFKQERDHAWEAVVRDKYKRR
jgi:bifunctional DNA-binding transcriptional regulator/antitoxin component of YhaV-PrlF toxin-antitoxin module